MRLEDELIEEALTPFERTSLEALSSVALLRRFDSKFVVPSAWIPMLLVGLQRDCQLLEVEGKWNTQYDNLYFESPNDACLVDHLRGKGHRFKIRSRSYSTSGVTYLEVKERMHNGRTIKHRLQRSAQATWSAHPFTPEEQRFLIASLPDNGLLTPALQNSFDRITLANFERGERITIDRNLEFEDASGRRSGLKGLAVIELKQPRKTRSTPLHNLLKSWSHGVHRQGVLGRSTRVSKYTVARLRCDPDLRRRTYGATLRGLERAVVDCERLSSAGK